MPDYEAPGAVRRLPGEKFADFAARQRASQLAAKPARKPYKGCFRSTCICRSEIQAQDCNNRVHRETMAHRRKYVESYEDRLDDLGESPDR